MLRDLVLALAVGAARDVLPARGRLAGWRHRPSLRAEPVERGADLALERRLVEARLARAVAEVSEHEEGAADAATAPAALPVRRERRPHAAAVLQREVSRSSAGARREEARECVRGVEQKEHEHLLDAVARKRAPERTHAPKERVHERRDVVEPRRAPRPQLGDNAAHALEREALAAACDPRLPRHRRCLFLLTLHAPARTLARGTDRTEVLLLLQQGGCLIHSVAAAAVRVAELLTEGGELLPVTGAGSRAGEDVGEARAALAQRGGVDGGRDLVRGAEALPPRAAAEHRAVVPAAQHRDARIVGRGGRTAREVQQREDRPLVDARVAAPAGGRGGREGALEELRHARTRARRGQLGVGADARGLGEARGAVERARGLCEVERGRAPQRGLAPAAGGQERARGVQRGLVLAVVALVRSGRG